MIIIINQWHTNYVPLYVIGVGVSEWLSSVYVEFCNRQDLLSTGGVVLTRARHVHNGLGWLSALGAPAHRRPTIPARRAAITVDGDGSASVCAVPSPIRAPCLQRGATTATKRRLRHHRHRLHHLRHRRRRCLPACLPRAIHYEIIPASRRAVPPRRSPDRTCGACVSVSVRDAQWCSRAGSASEYAVCHHRHSVVVAFILSWNTVHEMRPGKKKQKHIHKHYSHLHPSFLPRFTLLHNLLLYDTQRALNLTTTAYSYIITTPTLLPPPSTTACYH